MDVKPTTIDMNTDYQTLLRKYQDKDLTLIMKAEIKARLLAYERAMSAEEIIANTREAFRGCR